MVMAVLPISVSAIATVAPAPWLAAARARYASLQGEAPGAKDSNPLRMFAAYANMTGAVAAAEPPLPSYKSLISEGTASVWSALDNHYDPDAVWGFSDEAYQLMTDDQTRTPLFAKAIAQRIGESPPKTLTILDIGTGPFALLSVLAAEAGARKVYALEVNPDAARRARDTIEAAGWSDVIEVLEGFSTSLELPEKVDVVVSEIVGSIASEEGLYASIRDAHARFVKEPSRRDSWIPHTVETIAAPCSYPLHYALRLPRYDWAGVDEPLRISCLNPTLLALATPQRVESIAFADGAPTPAPVDAAFQVSAATLESNELAYLEALRGQHVEAETAKLHAGLAARSLSGLAMWPRLVLRGDEEIVVDSRGPGSSGTSAAPGYSAWQTVLPLMHGLPVTVEAGDVVRTRSDVDLPDSFDEPVWYTIEYT